MRYEKWAIFFVSLLVLIIASLSIIGTVIMLILEKRDEERTLLAIGADKGFIRGVFVREGLLLSGIGGAIGLLLGVAVTLAQQHFGFVKMPNGNFLVENYPVELQAGDLIVIFVVFVAVALAVSVLATSTMIKREKR
jgi:lipoprotein-releasing system permease protein